MTVDLGVLPEAREQVIVVGTAVRKPIAVLRHYLDSLAWQLLPPRTRLHPVFVADYEDPNDPALGLLKQWTQERGGTVLGAPGGRRGDFADTALPTHLWTRSSMERVGRNKDRIIAEALRLKADALWLADADLLMAPTTCWSLWHTGKPIVCAVYWTHWQRPTPEAPAFAMPQVWLTHPYGLAGRGYESWEFRDRLAQRHLTEVWGQGACTLIRQEALPHASFAYLPDLPQEGMWSGEDRHFCVRAERKHLPMFADPWPDIFHQYHLPEDEARAAQFRERLGRLDEGSPQVGGGVSLLLRAVEPVPAGPQAMMQVPAQHVRGRLGALPLAPELEAAVRTMRRGDSLIVPCHFGPNHPLPFFHGKRRLIQVTLIDHRSWGYAPVLEDEITRGLDRAFLTPRQQEAV